MQKAMRTYRLTFRPRPAAFFACSLADLAWAAREPGAGEFADARWPAHLHINVAPEAVVPGLRHHGRRVHQRTMVWSADRTAEEAGAGARTSAKRR